MTQPSDRARKAARQAYIAATGTEPIGEPPETLLQAFATFERETPGFAAGVWSSDLSAAPHACHVLAARFNDDVGDWVMGVVASPPIYPYTHWRMLDTPAPPADLCADIAQKSADAIARLEVALIAARDRLYKVGDHHFDLLAQIDAALTNAAAKR